MMIEEGFPKITLRAGIFVLNFIKNLLLYTQAQIRQTESIVMMIKEVLPKL